MTRKFALGLMFAIAILTVATTGCASAQKRTAKYPVPSPDVIARGHSVR